MSEGNGKNGKTNGKSIELAITHKGNLAPKNIAGSCWKPGQSGNPTGRPKNPKKKAFVDYLGEFFDEEVMATNSNGVQEKMPRAKYFARMVGTAAMSSQQIPIKRECIQIVIETLWPKPKSKRPFIEINQYHDNRAIGFVDRLNVFADGATMTPDMVIEALRLDAQGKLDDKVVSEMYPNEDQA